MAPSWNRTKAGELKSWDAPDDFPGDANLQDYWRTHRDYWGEAGAFSAEEMAAIAEAGVDEIWDERGFASIDAMLAAGHLRSDGAEPTRHILHHFDGASDAAQGLMARLITARLAKRNAVNLTGAQLGPGASKAIKVQAPKAVELTEEEDGAVMLSHQPPALYGAWARFTDLGLKNAHLGTADLQNAQFHGDAELENAQFHGDANLRSAHFHRNARLQNAQFHGDAWLENAHFHGNAGLQNAQFHGDANLRSAQFHGDADLRSAQFHGHANLRSAQFHRNARLQNAQFRGSAELENAQFHGDAMAGERPVSRRRRPAERPVPRKRLAG